MPKYLFNVSVPQPVIQGSLACDTQRRPFPQFLLEGMAFSRSHEPPCPTTLSSDELF